MATDWLGGDSSFANELNLRPTRASDVRLLCLRVTSVSPFLMRAETDVLRRVGRGGERACGHCATIQMTSSRICRE
jgi:hypothetical protein